MKNEDIWVGLEVYVERLRPKWSLLCDKREEGLEGIIIGKYEGWAPGAWVVKHDDGTMGKYYCDELEVSTMIYWHKLRKWYGYK